MPPAPLLVLAPLDPVVVLALLEVEHALLDDAVFLPFLLSDLVQALLLFRDDVEFGRLLRSSLTAL